MNRIKDTLNNSDIGDDTFTHKDDEVDLDYNDNPIENQDHIEFIEHNLFRELNELFYHAHSKGIGIDFFEFVLQYRIKQFEFRQDILRADLVRSYLYPGIQEALR